MKSDCSRMKRHIVSMRISSEEFNSLQEIMKGRQFNRVSDLMREAFMLVLTTPALFGHSPAESRDRIGGNGN